MNLKNIFNRTSYDVDFFVIKTLENSYKFHSFLTGGLTTHSELPVIFRVLFLNTHYINCVDTDAFYCSYMSYSVY